MSFLSKLKQMAGIGTLDVKVQMAPHFQATDTALTGTLHITAKSDQSVVKILLELEEKFESGRDDDKKTKLFTLGSLRLEQPFEMKSGEVKALPFSVPFELKQSSNDQLKAKGGLMGTIGKMGAWADDEKRSYEFRAVVDVKGTSLDPRDSVSLKLLK